MVLTGANLSLNLSAIANQGGSDPESTSRIESIEIIRLYNPSSESISLTLTAKDVMDMSGMNLFNNFTGGADGTYNLAAGGADGVNPEARHQLLIDGGVGTTLNSSGWGASVGTVTNSGITYYVYNQDLAQLLVSQYVTASVL